MEPRVDGGKIQADNYGLFISRATDYTRPDKTKPRAYPEKPVGGDFSYIEPQTLFHREPNLQSGKGLFIVILLVALYFGFK